MSIDATSLAYGFAGLAAGATVSFWRKKRELEERCEFLSEIRDDLTQAFAAADDILGDRHIPKPIREITLVLLAAHADPVKGKRIARNFMEFHQQTESAPADGNDPISQSMSMLGRHSPALARKTHHVLASLTFGLVFLNLADSIKVERVKDEAAKDPVSLWARIARAFSPGSDPDHRGGRLLHV